MSDFNHPNIIKLLAISISPKSCLILSEYMNRGDLEGLLINDMKEGREWIPKDQLECARQAAEGLQYLHVVKSFVHRDVAARNILVSENPSGQRTCKLTDFGLSRDLQGSGYYRRSKGKAAVLPVKWMALESIDYRIYNQLTDVWSFGVLLYEIFSMGVEPYPDVDNAKVYLELQNGLKLSWPKNCPGPLYDLMLNCTSLIAEKRPTFALILTRLEEEIQVDHLTKRDRRSLRDYVTDNSSGELQHQSPLLQRFSDLSRRISLTEIKSSDDISKLKKEEIQDILHSNFVSFENSDSVDKLAGELRSLWIDRLHSSPV